MSITLENMEVFPISACTKVEHSNRLVNLGKQCLFMLFTYYKIKQEGKKNI